LEPFSALDRQEAIMTHDHVRPTEWRPARRAPVLPILTALAVASLLMACSSNTPAPSSSIDTATSAAGTAPTTEPIPSLGADPATPGDGTGNGDNGSNGDGDNSGSTVEVKAPTLGSHFSGTPGWGPNDQTFGDLNITIAADDTAHYDFGLFAESGETGLAYGDTTLDPEDGYFHLTAGCSGKQIAATQKEIKDDPDHQCNELSFDPTSGASASNPFDAVLTVHFQLTCTGQDSQTCRQASSAKSASPQSPVVLDFSQVAKLHGSLSDGESSAAGSPSERAPVSESFPDASADESVEPTG
jgi:hypothetical protein